VEDGAPHENETVPNPVPLPSLQVAKVTAGDSHTVALTKEGAVYYWGAFRDLNGRLGLSVKTSEEVTSTPTRFMPFDVTVVDIASGSNHILLVTDAGVVYSLGVAEQGQLGRLTDPESVSGNKDLSMDMTEEELEKKKKENNQAYWERLLTPQVVSFDHIRPGVVVDRVWAGSHSSFARTVEGEIIVWGLNNNYQLGYPRDANTIIEWKPKQLPSFIEDDALITSIVGGEMHTLVLDDKGRVYSCGRFDYGRLGHPDLKSDVETFRRIESFAGHTVIDISCGSVSSFAVTSEGHLYSWGMGSYHLGHTLHQDDDPEDVWIPKRVPGKRLEKRLVKAVASGSQHVVIIVVGEETNGQ
jgi:regulator of chromosome condensation